MCIAFEEPKSTGAAARSCRLMAEVLTRQVDTTVASNQRGLQLGFADSAC